MHGAAVVRGALSCRELSLKACMMHGGELPWQCGVVIAVRGRRVGTSARLLSTAVLQAAAAGQEAACGCWPSD
jgi:hypothetical protein